MYKCSLRNKIICDKMQYIFILHVWHKKMFQHREQNLSEIYSVYAEIQLTSGRLYIFWPTFNYLFSLNAHHKVQNVTMSYKLPV